MQWYDANNLNESELFDLAQDYMVSNEMELMEQVVVHLVSCGFERDEVILDLIEGIQDL